MILIFDVCSRGTGEASYMTQGAEAECLESPEEKGEVERGKGREGRETILYKMLGKITLYLSF